VKLWVFEMLEIYGGALSNREALARPGREVWSSLEEKPLPKLPLPESLLKRSCEALPEFGVVVV